MPGGCSTHFCSSHFFSLLTAPHHIVRRPTCLRLCIPRALGTVTITLGFTAIFCLAICSAGHCSAGTSMSLRMPKSNRSWLAITGLLGWFIRWVPLTAPPTARSHLSFHESTRSPWEYRSSGSVSVSSSVGSHGTLYRLVGSTWVSSCLCCLASTIGSRIGCWC